MKKWLVGQVNLRDAVGRTALWRAAHAGQTNEVGSLIDAGADVTVSAVTDENPNNGGAMPLHVACQHGYTEVVVILLARGADTHKGTKGTDGRHAPMYCKPEWTPPGCRTTDCYGMRCRQGQ